MHLARSIAFWAQRRGDELALACDGEALSWAQLARDSAALAAHLAASGVVAGDRVGCLLGNGLPWCVAYVASIRLGTIFVPLNTLFGRFELEQIARDADCAAILSCPSQISRLGVADTGDGDDAPRLYHLRRSGTVTRYADIVAAGLAFADPPHPDEDVLLISYTSGTTGIPKGVALTHRNVDAAIAGLILAFGLRGGDERLLILAPLAFTGGVVSNLTPLLITGGSGWIEKTVDPARALRLLTTHRISFFGGVPALWERIALAPDFAGADLSDLRVAYTGGAPVSRALMDTFLAKNVTIRQQYGFTEACGGVSAPTRAGAAAAPGSCGHALPGIDLLICDERGERVSGDTVGEVRARGVQLMQGYWNQPGATAAAFDDGWYRTGDLARYDADGAIVVVDRKKNMLISGGVNIYPAEVERALAQIVGVLEVAAIGLPSERWGQEVAAIVYAPGLSDAARILEQARELLGPYKAPKHLRLSPQPLPKTVSNKVARSGLDALFDSLPA